MSSEEETTTLLRKFNSGGEGGACGLDRFTRVLIVSRTKEKKNGEGVRKSPAIGGFKAGRVAKVFHHLSTYGTLGFFHFSFTFLGPTRILIDAQTVD